MRLKKHLEENYKQDIAFAKKRLIKFIDNIENSINIMSKTKITDKAQAASLEKIYKEIKQKTETAKSTVKNSKVDEMFEPDVLSKNILRLQMKSIEKQLKVMDNRFNKGFLEKTKVVDKLRTSLLSVWNMLQKIYKIIGKRK